MNQLVSHNGSCHCGAACYEVGAPADLLVQECSCSICSRTGYLHLIIPRSRFHLIQNEEYLTTHTFDAHGVKHKFCRDCGIESFYFPRPKLD